MLSISLSFKGVIHGANGEGLKKVRTKMMKKVAIVSGLCGNGRVILCGPHPEATEGLEDYTLSLITSAMRVRKEC